MDHKVKILTYSSLQYTLTRTCQTFSLEPSKEQNLTLTPRRPCPPHVRLGTITVCLIDCVLLLYTVSDNFLSTPPLRSSFNVSLSWSYGEGMITVIKRYIQLEVIYKQQTTEMKTHQAGISDRHDEVEECFEASFLSRRPVLYLFQLRKSHQIC